jgi:ribosome-associated toxin RatA of RatAB toxin-antitoxin module
MAVVHKTVFLGYSAEQMYSLVNDMDEYPNFLPWCGGVEVQHLDESRLLSTMGINYHGVKQSFTTENMNTPPTQIRMDLVKGPFKHLTGTWNFKSLREDACKIEFDLEYEFSSKMLEQIIGPVFSKIAHTIVECFCKRAEAVYG